MIDREHIENIAGQPNLSAEPEKKPFTTLEEELDYLRAQVKAHEATIGGQKEQDQIIREEIKEYHANTGRDLLHESYKATPQEHETRGTEIVLKLSPEAHDKNMEEYFTLMEKYGIHNALSAIHQTKNPHLEDDFHRFLVEYLKAGLTIKDLKEGEPIQKSITHTLYEVSLPDFKADKKDAGQRPLKELLSAMEQFYAGMMSISDAGKKQGDSKNHMTIELAVADASEEFIFYVSIPDAKADLFEKHILSVFPGAKIEIKHDDYNIFNSDGSSVGSYATSTKNEIFPIKMYDEFDHDPLQVTLNTLSKIQREGEGASVQVVFSQVGDYYTKLFKESLDKVRKGDSLKKSIDIRHTMWGHFTKAAGELGKELVEHAVNGDDKNKKDKEKVVDQIALEQITKKITTPIVETNIRLVASAANTIRAEQILSDLESSFNQFNNALGNGFSWERPEKARLQSFLHDFSFRIFNQKEIIPLSIKELSSVMHFPMLSGATNAPQLKQSKAGTAPAPLDLPRTGVLLGKNLHRNVEQPVYMAPEDRLRHMYVIGQTGVGKSSILKNLILQDIKNGEGVCFIDPHGSDIQDILSKIPKDRFDDVIYFDPSYTERPMALNMLEYDPSHPEQKTFVVNELFSIFQKLYGGVPESMGPMFEQYFRNATMLVIEDPSSGCTLLDVSRVMAVKSFRDMKISRCKNPIVRQFWVEIAEKTSGESGLANMVPYITSKFDVFLANDIMRPIIAQEHSSFNFREIMDKKKILLVNLAKGKLGEINSNLIGLIIVGKILMAALSRVDSFGKDMPPFYLYIDEFQNVTTPSISTILSEARKYKLSLTMAHQFIAQLDDKIKASVFGNVGNMVVYRVGAEDAEYLEKQFEPTFMANDIMNIDNFNAYVKMLSYGKPTKPFNIQMMPQEKGNPNIVENLKELSYLTYGQDRDMVEEGIMEKYKKEEKKEEVKSPLSMIK
ncbi:MAG: type IV secretory system conjugative DNA transfer family protein [Patescibacteria group bacterium]